MALLNCMRVTAAHMLPPNTSWRPLQWIPYELARAKKAGSVTFKWAAGWSRPQVHPPESRVSTYCLPTSAAATPRAADHKDHSDWA
jgi:hypothetical protein